MLIQNDRIKVSSDISRRFIFKKSFKIREIEQISDVWENSTLARGEWIVVDESGVFYAGMIINFQKCNEKTKSMRLYSHDELNLTELNSSEISVLLQPLLSFNRKNFVPSTTVNKYFKSNRYVCHIKNDEIDLNIQLREIMNHYKVYLKKNK